MTRNVQQALLFLPLWYPQEYPNGPHYKSMHLDSLYDRYGTALWCPQHLNKALKKINYIYKWNTSNQPFLNHMQERDQKISVSKYHDEQSHGTCQRTAPCGVGIPGASLC